MLLGLLENSIGIFASVVTVRAFEAVALKGPMFTLFIRWKD
jgi:hypothetical protein